MPTGGRQQAVLTATVVVGHTEVALYFDMGVEHRACTACFELSSSPFNSTMRGFQLSVPTGIPWGSLDSAVEQTAGCVLGFSGGDYQI